MLIVLALLSGCRQSAGNGFVELTGKLFVFNYRVSTATFLVTLSKTKPLPEGAHIRASFDNPAGGAPIVVEEKIWPKIAMITIESPPLRCVRKDVPYAFVIELLTLENSKLQSVSGTIVSSLNQEILGDRPLVVGPGYALNEENLKPDGGAPGYAEKKACEAK